MDEMGFAQRATALVAAALADEDSLDVELARTPSALVVPLDAVRKDGERAFVSVQRGSSFEERQVTLGAKNAHEVVVASGIDAGAVVARNVARNVAGTGARGTR